MISFNDPDRRMSVILDDTIHSNQKHHSRKASSLVFDLLTTAAAEHLARGWERNDNRKLAVNMTIKGQRWSIVINGIRLMPRQVRANIITIIDGWTRNADRVIMA